jgi:membrane protein implicated in regulation of membrane protease activity
MLEILCIATTMLSAMNHCNAPNILATTAAAAAAVAVAAAAVVKRTPPAQAVVVVVVVVAAAVAKKLQNPAEESHDVNNLTITPAILITTVLRIQDLEDR